MITLLAHFKEGLSLKELMYALIEEYKPGISTTFLEERFGKPRINGIIYELLNYGRIKRYEPKFKRDKTTKKIIGKTEISVRTRNNIKNHLDRMKKRGWVYKEGMRYKLVKEVFIDRERYPHLEELQTYKNNQIYPSSSFPPESMEKPSDYYTQIILYGITNEVIDKETNEIITKELNKIRKSFLRLSMLQASKKVPENIALSIIWKQVKYPQWKLIIGKTKLKA